MARKKPVRVRILSAMQAFKRGLKDYPESMSGYERESLAAEDVLAEERKKKGTRKPKAR
jgi:hypothetical protein